MSEKTARPLISLTMIVKNEADGLPRVLESARGIADEIVVVDTGSTDDTVAIARRYGAQVHFFKWIDDFSAARNFALEHAAGEWILILDGDDVAVETHPGAVRAEVSAQPEDVYFLRVNVKSPKPEGGGYTLFGSRRIFRNTSKIRWRFPIHENLFHSEADGPEHDAACRSLVIEHSGYADDRQRGDAKKGDRNMRILKAELARNPEDARLYYYLSVEYANKGQHTSALRLIRKGLRLFGDRVRPDFAGTMRVQGMKCALSLGQPEAAIKLGLPGVKSYAYSELCYVLGCAYFQAGEMTQAERYFELAIALRGRLAEFQLDAGTGSWKALLELGNVSMVKGDTERAIERFRRAHEWAPDEALTNLGLGRGLLMAANDAAAAEPYLQRSVELAPGMPEANARYSQALTSQGKHQEAYDHLDRLVREYPEVESFWEWLGELLHGLDEHEACVDLLGRAIARHSKSSRIYFRLGSSLRHLGRYQDAFNAFALASALEPESAAARAGLAAAAHALEWGTAAPEAVSA